MTTPTTPPTTPPEYDAAMEQDLSAGELEALLVRRAELQRIGHGLRMNRILAARGTPPGPRDLTVLTELMRTAQEHDDYYFDQPGWVALERIYQRAGETLSALNAQAERTPQAAIQAARITALAASLMARHAAEVSAYFRAGNRNNNPGAEAMRMLARAAETLALRAAGLDEGQTFDTPRLLRAHLNRLNRELQRAEAGLPGPPTDPGLDDPDDPALHSALSIGAKVDLEIVEAAGLMNALSGVAAWARRVGYRAVLDVRLHGMIETAQLRGFELIANIARRAMNRYDARGRQSDGRRDIAAMICHYAEQRLERMRGTLGPDERREPGYYEEAPRERYQDALQDESRSVAQDLKSASLAPRDRTDLQIRFLLAERALAARAGDPQWGTQPDFPPSVFVAGFDTRRLAATGLDGVDAYRLRVELIEALRARVESKPFHRDAAFFNQVNDRYAREIAGPGELTLEALDADITAAQITEIAQQVVLLGTVASPLALSSIGTLNLTFAQAERALDVLQSFGIVGPPNPLQPRETRTSTAQDLAHKLADLAERLPQLLAEQRGILALPQNVRHLLKTVHRHTVLLDAPHPLWESIQNIATAAGKIIIEQGVSPDGTDHDTAYIERVQDAASWAISMAATRLANAVTRDTPDHPHRFPLYEGLDLLARTARLVRNQPPYDLARELSLALSSPPVTVAELQDRLAAMASAEQPPPAPTPTPPQSPQAAPDLLHRAALAAAAIGVASPEAIQQALSIPPPAAQALMDALRKRNLLRQAADGAWEPTYTVEQIHSGLLSTPPEPPTPAPTSPRQEPVQAAAPEQPMPAAPTPPPLPRRDRTEPRAHPGNRVAEGAHAPAAATADADVMELLAGSEGRILEASQQLQDSVTERFEKALAARAQASAPVRPSTPDQAQQTSQQAEKTTGVTTR
ncbi:hypothetical protein ABZ864_40695 [Streptomyces sp. NPDC047082]|uniref:hypothetical protein n=1 Tax=Streptomyces sp. NPDC047082 TaxID=3155259 RepID=UPI0033D23B94